MDVWPDRGVPAVRFVSRRSGQVRAVAADGRGMDIPPIAPTAPPAPGSTPDTPPEGAFDASLQRALAAPTTATDRTLTLGQMLHSYATTRASGAATTVPALSPPPRALGTAGIGTLTHRSDGGELGIGPLARPVPGAVGSGHGPRRHPIHGDVRMHDGVDMAGATGTPIHAFAAGTVTFAGPRGGYGNVVIVEHPGGLETRYAHQSGIDVAVGQHVEAGQVLGRVGATGTATGPHLHFELRRDGTSIDPAPYLA